LIQSPAILASFPFRPAASKRHRAYHEGGVDYFTTGSFASG